INLAKYALRNPNTVLMTVLGCLILGIISFSKLPVDMFPEITFPSITVATFYPGANPQDMERMVTYPVEKAVSTVNGVKYVSSISRQGASLVTIYFNWGTNLDEAEIEHVPNGAAARVVGGKIREIQVHFDRQHLQAFNLSPEAIIQAVQQANLILPSGDFKAGLYDYRLFTETQFSLVKPIENIIVSNVRNRPVYIRDIGEARADYQEQTK